MPETGKPYLRALVGPLAGKEVPLEGDRMTLGRGSNNDIVLPDADLAEQQAVLRRENGRWILENCASETHIFERHIPVERCEFRPGNPIRIGSTMFEIVYRQGDPDERPTEPCTPQTQGQAPPPGVGPRPDFFAGTAGQTAGPAGANPERRIFAPGQSVPSAPLAARPSVESKDEALPSGLVEHTDEGRSGPPRYAALAKAGNFLYTLFVIGLVIGGALLVHLFGRRAPEPPTLHVLIPEGGSGTMVPVRSTYRRIGGEGDERWRQIVDLKEVDPPIMVEVVGKNQGTAEVPLYYGRHHVATLHVTVRGRAWKEPVFRPDRDLETLLAEARVGLERGRQLQRDHLYQSVEECYRPAAEFLARLDDPRARSLEIEARRLLLEAESDLNQRLRECEDEFWLARRLNDHDRSLRQLQLILEWVPDGSDKRHQRAAILADVIRRTAGH